MELFSKFNYVIELMLLDLVFLAGFPRRSRFPLRFILAAAVSLAVGYIRFNLFTYSTVLLQFLSILTAIAVTVAGMYFCFQSSFAAIFSACCAGVAIQHIGYHISLLIAMVPALPSWNALMEFLTCLVLCAVAFFALRKRMEPEFAFEGEHPSITVVSVGIVLICIGLTRLVRLSGTMNVYASLVTSLYAILCCSMALLIRFFLYRFIRLNSEHLVLQHIQEEERRQFELDRENAELLSIKHHDLKQMVASLESRLPQKEMDSLKEIMDSYDTTYHTGLDALDIILNEKNARCRSKNILLTCMGSGAELSFMDLMDVYSVFGNVLENAITAVEKIEIPEKRLISLIIQKKGSFVMISAVNYSDTAPQTFSDGLPSTTKDREPGYHGYGLKSIRLIAQKYNGDIAVSAENGMFQLDIFMECEPAA